MQFGYDEQSGGMGIIGSIARKFAEQLCTEDETDTIPSSAAERLAAGSTLLSVAASHPLVDTFHREYTLFVAPTAFPNGTGACPEQGMTMEIAIHIQVNSSNIDHIHPNAFLTELNVHAIKLQINRYPPLVAEEPAALFALHDMQRLHVVNLQTWISMRGSRHSLELISRLTESELKATLHTIADVCSGGHGHVSEFMKNANPSQRALFNCLNISGRKV